jgi:hypothetical protein
MNIEVPTKYPLSQDRIVVFEIRLHSKSPMLYRPALHGNWNALSLTRRVLKNKFSTPTVPLKTVLPNRQVFLPDPVHCLHACNCWHVRNYPYRFCCLIELEILKLQYQRNLQNCVMVNITDTHSVSHPPGWYWPFGARIQCPVQSAKDCVVNGQLFILLCYWLAAIVAVLLSQRSIAPL